MTKKRKKDFPRTLASIPITSVPIQRRGDILPSFCKVFNGCHKPAGGSVYISHQHRDINKVFQPTDRSSGL